MVSLQVRKCLADVAASNEVDNGCKEWGGAKSDNMYTVGRLLRHPGSCP